jgi:hypothetical protein
MHNCASPRKERNHMGPINREEQLKRTKGRREEGDVDIIFPIGSGKRYDVRSVVVTLIVAAVLLPAARFSFGLSAPQPSELIVAICIAVFSSLLCLWLLDVTGVFPFRSVWVSRSVYGAAVVAILGTTVGVYQGAFSDRKHPLEGAWELQVSDKDGVATAHRNVVLIHSESAADYWGYSDFDAISKSTSWLEVRSLSPETGSITIRLVSGDGTVKEIVGKVKLAASRRRIDPVADGDTPRITLTRQH